MSMAHVGVLLDRQAAEDRWRDGHHVFGAYIGEVLGHAGIPFTWLPDADALATERPDIVVIGLAADDDYTAHVLWVFAQEGGTVIAFGGLTRLCLPLGCTESPVSGPGYAVLPPEFGHLPALRFLSASPWMAASSSRGDVKARAVGSMRPRLTAEPLGGPALFSFAVGRGYLDRWAADIMDSIVRLQQGSGPVTEDGLPAPDGSANVDDGILKADDGCALDWEADRLYTETGAPYFAHPYADFWREAVCAHLLGHVVRHGMTLPFLGYWPAGVPHVAMTSHDSDDNHDEHALTTLQVLRDLGIHSTWCIIEPGYSRPIYEAVLAEGHELALHYNALHQDGGHWAEAAFAQQITWLHSATAPATSRSNKNHYTRFEGWGELFQWCERYGISSDQTRGPSKRGNVGFLFGTCHPYVPIAWHDERNRFYDVLEISFLSQDLNYPGLSDPSVIEPFLQGVARVQGVAHILFHQRHIHNLPQVRSAFQAFVHAAQAQHFAFWTATQIDTWERARRGVRIIQPAADAPLSVYSATEIDNLIIWLPLSTTDGVATEAAEQRFGVLCRKVVVPHLAAGTTTSVP